MKNRKELDCRLSLAAIVAATGLAIGTAHADDVISFEGYTAGPLAGKIDPGTANVWELESPAESQPAMIVTGINSPMGTGNTAVQWTLQAPSGNTTLHGLDLSQQYNTGIVEVSYDFYMGDFMNDRTGGQGGRNILRPRLLNSSVAAGAGNTGVGADADLLFISYIRDWWTEKYGHLTAYSSVDGAGFGWQVNLFSPTSQVFSQFSVSPRTWMRVRHYFDYTDATNPGRLLYSAIYDINDGTERRIAERRPAETPVLGMSETAAASADGPGIAAIQLDLTTDAFTDNNPQQTWYLDNLAVRQHATFTAPPALDQLPAPTVRPAQETTRAQEATLAFDFAAGGLSACGPSPAMEVIGDDLYTYDASSNNLVRWDMTGVAPADFMELTSNVSNANQIGTMVSSSDGTKLYFTSTSPTGEWGALYSYDIASESDGGVPVVDCFANNYGGGEHSAARYTVGGQDRVIAAWRGAQFFDSYAADGVSAAGGIGGIGNRWDGGCCEGTAPNEIFALFRVGLDGLRSSVPNPQASAVQNAIYRVTFTPGGGVPLFEPLSPSLQVLPWLPNGTDGPGLGTHRMQYVPQTNSIWVVRGSGSNHIGVYDIDTDAWTVIEVSLPGGNPFAMDKTDIQLAGDNMLILSEGQAGVYSINAVNLGDLPTGACCVAGVCSFQTGPDCAAMGGTYAGDGSECTTYEVAMGSNPIEDISATGTNLITAGVADDGELTRPLPFSFDFYGQTFTEVAVGGNGYVRMGPAQPCSNCWANSPLPAQDTINNTLYPMWFDFSPQIVPGGLYEEVRGTAPNRRYIVHFDAVTRWNGAGAYESMNSFQVILYEADDSIEFRYGVLQDAGGTVGVENSAGTWAVSVDSATLAAGDSLLFTSAATCDTLATCACETDGNDAQVDVFDLLAYLDLWFVNAAGADIDGAAGVDVFDLLFFLDCWFPASAGSPCP